MNRNSITYNEQTKIVLFKKQEQIYSFTEEHNIRRT